MVASEKVTLPNRKNEFSAIPVMIPGRASGRTSTKDTASRPKNRKRCTANAAAEPRRSAIALASNPAFTDSSNADRTCGSCHVDENHRVVHPGIGQLWMLDVLNADTRINRIGTKRNASNSATQARRTHLG